jgi:Predicted solute binding protein
MKIYPNPSNGPENNKPITQPNLYQPRGDFEGRIPIDGFPCRTTHCTTSTTTTTHCTTSTTNLPTTTHCTTSTTILPTTTHCTTSTTKLPTTTHCTTSTTKLPTTTHCTTSTTYPYYCCCPWCPCRPHCRPKHHHCKPIKFFIMRIWRALTSAVAGIIALSLLVLIAIIIALAVILTSL